MIGALTGLSAIVAGLFLTGPVHEPVRIDIDAVTAGGDGTVAQVVNVKTGSDWTAAAVVIELDIGEIVQDRVFASDDVKDAQALALPASASATGPEGFGKPVLAAGACDDSLGGETPRLDAQRMDLCWYNQSPGDVGWGSIGRFTFSSSAVGRWTLAVTQAGDNARYTFGGTIIHGKMRLDQWP